MEDYKPLNKVRKVQTDEFVVKGEIESPEGAPEKIRGVLDGKEIEVTADPDQSILQTMMAAGHNPPYSCTSGNCMGCICRVLEGEVIQDRAHCLTESHAKLQQCLSCQAKPTSKIVKINFDAIF